MQILGAITRLRQICVDPSMFIENYQGGSGKIDYLLEVLTEKISDGHRVLVFSQFVKVSENIEVLVRKNDISYKVITGDTPAQERLNICNDFNNSEEIKVVLISLKAGGTGLNLVGADTVIHIDPWWNLAAQNQASDRAHRIGQTRAVEVIKIIAENSIEQKVLDIQNEKKELVELMIADNDESIKKLSIDELKSLLFTR
jgi:SNF2 family DNA or RNA helicase